MSISWTRPCSCSQYRARCRSWSSYWSSAGADCHCAVMMPCHSVPDHPLAMSHRSYQCAGDHCWWSHATPSSQAWDKTEMENRFLHFYCVILLHQFRAIISYWCNHIISASPCAVTVDILAIKWVNPHIVLHSAPIEDGFPTIKQNLILRKITHTAIETRGNRIFQQPETLPVCIPNN